VERTETKIDRALLQAVRARAAKEGRGEAEVIEEAVKRYLKEGRGRDLNDIFDSIQRHQQEQGVEPLSEVEAMKLAVEEQHAWRRERREQREREAGDGR
jgi:DNA-binding protein Fis